MKYLSSNNYENKIDALRSLYHVSGIPISLLYNGQNTFCIPSQIPYAANILHDETLLPKPDPTNKRVQLLQNVLKETALCLMLPEAGYYVFAGPFLQKSVNHGELTNMVQQGLIPFHQKTVLREYYDKCPVVPAKKQFYLSVLLDKLFLKDSEPLSNKVLESDVTSHQNNDFFRQMNDYRQDGFIHSPYDIEQEICRTISNGDSDNAKRILRDINRVPHARLASTRIRSVKNSTICSCTFMARAAIEGGVNPNRAFTLSDTYIRQIENMTTLNELTGFETVMIEGFTKMVREIKKQTYSTAILNTIYYIDNHLCEEISLDRLAKEAFLNKSYLSWLFHKETGETINAWIKRRRIEEAALFIQSGNDDFTKIASFYQFCSQSYFVKCFKEIMGVTPGEYARRGMSSN